MKTNIFLAIAFILGNSAFAAESSRCFDHQSYDAALASGLTNNKALIQAMKPCGAEYSNADVTAYDCSMSTISANKGKCTVVAVIEGKEVKLKASPEVAAPWGNGYGDASCRPMSKLGLVVSKTGEIITVKDSLGNKVTTKFDYSR